MTCLQMADDGDGVMMTKDIYQEIWIQLWIILDMEDGVHVMDNG